MNIEELKTKLEKGETVTNLVKHFDVSEFELFGYIKKLKDDGLDVISTGKGDNIRLIINYHPDYTKENVYNITEDVDDITKFAVISDTRFGSTNEQISILNDLYKKFKNENIKYVIIAGNLLEGEYKNKDIYEYGKSLISNTALGQANHFIEYFPKVEGITTLFITGKCDHTWSKELNIGEYIENNRSDLIYLGPKSANVNFNKVNFRIEALKKQGESYTIAYPPQKYARSLASYEDYDAIFLGGTLTAQEFPTIRDTRMFTIPSLVARTPKMRNLSQQNTIGAYTFDLSYNKNGKMKSLTSTLIPYYIPSKETYITLKPLVITSDKKVKEIKPKKDNLTLKLDNIYKYIKKEENFNDLMNKLGVNDKELMGIIDLLNQRGKNIEIIDIDDELIVKKNFKKSKSIYIKPPKEELHKKEFLVVSDTHYGSIYSEPSMVNTSVFEAYNRGITDIFHVGDITDGDYSRIRPIHNYEVFLYGATGQLEYTLDTLPKYPGMKWHVITGSHDQTHLFNYGVDIGKELEKRRDDIEFLGQDRGFYYFDNCKMELFHPGGGTSRILSTKPQNGIDGIPSKTKPKISLRGHYHKSYYMLYRNVHTFLCPCNVDTSSFMMKNEIPNLMGNYFITIWYNDNGDIEYLEHEPMIFTSNDVIKDDYKNPKKYIKRKIK